MKFNLKNYKYYSTYKIEKPEKGIGLEVKEDSLFDYQLQLPEIINELNNSKILNIESKEEIPIIFENFTWFTKIQTNVKNSINKIQGHEVLEHSIAHYKPNTKTIHIFNGIFNPTIKNEQFQTSYAKLTDSVSNNNFIVNLFVLHEIGHAIYNKILDDKDTNINYGNLTD